MTIVKAIRPILIGTLLMLAAEVASVDILRYLVEEKKANVNNVEETDNNE